MLHGAAQEQAVENIDVDMDGRRLPVGSGLGTMSGRVRHERANDTGRGVERFQPLK